MAVAHQTLIVGVGSIGERHLRCFGATGRTALALAEINPSLRDAVARRYPTAAAYADLEAALAARPDVAVVATPAHLHVPLARRLVDAGAHVLIEKPLSTSLDGIADLDRAARERGVAVGVAYVQRCHPLLAAVRQAVRDGRFGRPVQLVAVAGQHFPYYRPAYRDTYYVRRATGGGAIQDALTHLLNAGEWLVGPVDRLVADADHQVLDGVTVEDTVHVLARHGPVLASYSLNQHQAPNEVTLTVVCERGTVRCEYHEHRWRWQTDPAGAWQEAALAPLDRDALFIAQAHAFLDVADGRVAPPCSLQDGVQTLKVNLAALACLESPGWQTIS